MTAQPIEQVADYYRDPKTEWMLAKFPTTWELARIAVADIDLKSSRNYQNRATGDVRPEEVSRIAEALRDDTVETPPVVVRREGRRYIVADGNHRVYAHHEAGRTSIFAYVLTCDVVTFAEVATFANVHNALSLDGLERDRQIARAVAAGMSQAMVAAVTGMNANAIGAIVRADQGEAALRNAGLAAAHEKSKSFKIAAARLDPENLAAIGIDVLRQVSGEQMEDVARTILAAKPSEQLDTARQIGAQLRREQVEKRNPRAKRTVRVGWTEKRIANATHKLREVIAENSDEAVKPLAVEALELLVAQLRETLGGK